MPDASVCHEERDTAASLVEERDTCACPATWRRLANSQDLRWICEDAGDQQVRDLDDLDGAVSVTVVAF
jgi:hypothetical protein